MNKRILSKIHLWLSVPFGIILIVMCVSGALLVFERDLGHIGQAEVSSSSRDPLPLDSLLQLVEPQLAKGKSITGVTIYPDTEHAYKALLNKPAMAAVWVDQYTGKVTGEYQRAEIFKIASAAHRRLFGKTKDQGAYGAKLGKNVVGISTIALFFILLTGLLIWWPKKGHWKNALTIHSRKGAYRFWHDLHCVTGFFVTLMLLACIFTGLTWSYPAYKKAFYATMGAEEAKSASHKTPAKNFAAWQTAYAAVAQQNEGREIRVYQDEIDVVDGGFGNQQAVDTYYYDAESGQITRIEPYKQKSSSNHIKGWIYSLHVGSWGGMATKILYFILAIAGASLPITGYYLWIKRLRQK